MYDETIVIVSAITSFWYIVAVSPVSGQWMPRYIAAVFEHVLCNLLYLHVTIDKFGCYHKQSITVNLFTYYVIKQNFSQMLQLPLCNGGARP